MGFSLAPPNSREKRDADSSARLRALTSAADLAAVVRESHERPVLVLVHSRDCGLSHLALAHLRKHAKGSSGSVSYVVTVQMHRELCAALARGLALRHQTPQAILLQGGKAVWHRSHHNITAEALNAAVNDATDVDNSDDDDDGDDGEAPETPTDEPAPTPVQDPPNEPDQRPYTVSSGRGGISGG